MANNETYYSVSTLVVEPENFDKVGKKTLLSCFSQQPSVHLLRIDLMLIHFCLSLGDGVLHKSLSCYPRAGASSSSLQVVQS